MISNSLAIDSGRLTFAAPDNQGVRCFKGIPYAAPPVGGLRWRAPEPAHSWRNVWPADTFEMNAMQGVVFDDIEPSKPGISEDCLYLNVWSPTRFEGGERLPVLFWIHGGGFVARHGAEPRYDGARLAAHGIIVVTINYRLGVFGFLAHPALTVESPYGATGNWGLLDLVAALEWTRRNIAAFGGEPEAVTIAGESAGAAAVSALMASPLAKGLFARAIGQSGAFFSAPARKLETRAEAEHAGLAFAHRVGATSAEDLRKVPDKSILAAASGVGFRPIIDGHFYLLLQPNCLRRAATAMSRCSLVGTTMKALISVWMFACPDMPMWMSSARRLELRRTTSCKCILRAMRRRLKRRRVRSAAMPASLMLPGPGSRNRKLLALPTYSVFDSSARR